MGAAPHHQYAILAGRSTSRCLGLAFPRVLTCSIPDRRSFEAAFALAVCLGALFAAGTPAHAAVLEVSTSSTPGTFTSIQAAIDAARPDDTVRIQPGHYVECLELRGKPLTIEGATTPDEVIVDGGGACSVVSVSPTRGQTTLRSITLTGGAADLGGGLHARRSDLILDRVRLQSNRAARLGGGAWIDGGRVTFLDSEVSYNQAGSSGGVYIARTVQVSIQRTAFVRNRGMMGAGLHLQNAGGLISSCLFLENGRTEAGEGMAGEMSIYLQEGNGAGTRVVNNTFVRSGCCNIVVRATVGVEIENNIFESGAGYGVYVHQKGFPAPSAVPSVWLAYNNLHENAFADFKYVDPEGAVQELEVAGSARNIDGPPAFRVDVPYADWRANDYHLGSGSVSIDAGAPAPGKADMDGTRNDQGMFGGGDAPTGITTKRPAPLRQ